MWHLVGHSSLHSWQEHHVTKEQRNRQVEMDEVMNFGQQLFSTSTA